MSHNQGPTDTVLLVAGVLLVGLLCFEIYPVLSPFVILAALLFLLAPFREQAAPRRLIQVGVLLFLIWFSMSVVGVVAPFIIAFLFAYILEPAVAMLERKRFPRWASALVVVLVILGVAVAIGIFVVPSALEQLQSVSGQAGVLAGRASQAFESGTLFNFLEKFGVTQEKTKEMLMQNLTPKVEEILKRLFESLLGLVTSVTSLAQQLLNIVIIPVVLFYLLLDFPAVTHQCVMLVPKRGRERFVRLSGRVDSMMGRYLRGAILVAAIQGVISATGLWLIGVEYAIVLGIMTALLDFIPYIGLVISLSVGSIVALFSGGEVWTKVLCVVILYIAQKFLEATVLGPKILGKQVGLHPVLLILCLMVFGHFLGFVGLLVAVPATALIIEGVKEWETVRRQRRTAAE